MLFEFIIRINASSCCGVYSRAAFINISVQKCSVYSRAAFINISVLKCSVYSRAAFNRINTICKFTNERENEPSDN